MLHFYNPYILCDTNISLQYLKGDFPVKTIRTYLTTLLHHLRRGIEEETPKKMLTVTGGVFGRASERVLLPLCVL